MQAASHFGVNILSEAQQDLSNTFAASKPPEAGSLRGAPFRRAASGVPLLEGTLAWLDCQVDQAVDAGDHTIFIGRVLDGSVDSPEDPLLYFRGGYRTIG